VARKFYTSINLNKNELQNAVIHNLSSAPLSPTPGQIYYDTSTNRVYIYDGTTWLDNTGDIRDVIGTSPINVSVVSGNATVSILPASGSTAGSMSITDKNKLDNSTNLNTPSTLVIRDSSGNFSSNIITANDITILNTPLNSTDATNKAYVDSIIHGLEIKESVRLATTPVDGDIDLIGMTFGGTLDGYTVNAGDRVLIKNQSTLSENGIYVYDGGSPNTFTRSDDANTSDKVKSGMFCFINEGTLNIDTAWVLTTDNPIILESTSLTFTQFTQLGQITAGAGLTKTNDNILDINAGDNSITVNSDNIVVKRNSTGAIGIDSNGILINTDNTTIDINSNQLRVVPGAFTKKYTATGVSIGTTPGLQTITHNLNTRSVVVSIIDETTFVEYECDVIHATLNTITIQASGSTKTVTATIEG